MKALMFSVHGDAYTLYEGKGLPPEIRYVSGTWGYDLGSDGNYSPWFQLVYYTTQKKSAWEMYGFDAPDLIHLTKFMKMTALVMQ